MSALIHRENSRLFQNLPIELAFLIIEFMDPHIRLRILKQKYSAKYIQRRLMGIPRTPSNIAKIFHCFQLMKDMVECFDINDNPDSNYKVEYLSELSLASLLKHETMHNSRLLEYNELIENKNVLEKRKDTPDKRRRGKIHKYFLNCDISYAKQDIVCHKKWMDSNDAIKDYISLISRTISQFKKIYIMDIREIDRRNMELLLLKIYKQALLI
jgi:hypothetical protein